MSTVVADLIARLGLDTSKFKEGIQQAGTETNKLKQAVEQTGKPVESLGRSMDDAAKGPAKALKDAFSGLGSEGAGLAGRLSGVVTSLGAVGVAIGSVALITSRAVASFSDFTTRVRDLSYMSGGSLKSVSALVAGMEDLGVESETVQVAMNRMSAAITSGDPALARLGVSSRTTSGHLKDGLTLFYETVDALKTMTNETERNSLARDIFGRGWTSIMPILRKGSEEIRRLGEESGKAITAEHVRAVQEFKLATKELGEVWERFAITIGEKVVPVLSKVLSIITAMASPARGMSVDLAERARLLENMDPSGRIRAALPSGAFSSDAGAWRMGAAGEPVEPGRTGGTEKPQPFEIELNLKYQADLLKLRSQMVTVMGPANNEEEKYAETLRVTNDNLKTSLSLLDERIRLERATINFQYEQGKLGTVGTDAALGQRSGLLSATTAAGERERVNLITANQAKLVDLERAHRDALLAQQERYNKASISLIEILAREESNYISLALEQQRAAIAEGQRIAEMDRRQKIADLEKFTEEAKAKLSWLPSSGEGDAGGGAVSPEDIAGAYRNAQSRRTAEQQSALAMRARELGGVDSLPLAELEQNLKNIDINVKLLGGDFDVLTERINANRNAMLEMRANGVEPTDARLQQLSATLKDLQQTAELRQSFRDLFGGIASAWSTSMQGIIQGTTTMSDAFKNMARSIALSISNVLVNGALKDLERSLENLIFSTGTSSKGSSLATTAIGGIAGWIASLFGGSGGSTVGGTGYGPDYYASGGIVTKPTMAVLGEKGPELILNKTQFNSLPIGTQKDILDQLSASGGSTSAGASAIAGTGRRNLWDDPSLIGGGDGGPTGPRGTTTVGPMNKDERSIMGWAAALTPSVMGINPFSTMVAVSRIAGWLGAVRETDPTLGMATGPDLQSIADVEGYMAAAARAASDKQSIADWNASVATDLSGYANYAGTSVQGGWGPSGFSGMTDLGGGFGTQNAGGTPGASTGDPANSVGSEGSPFGGSGGVDSGNSDTSGTADSTGGSRGGEGPGLAKGGFVTRRWQGMIGEAGPEVVLPKSMLKGLRIPRMAAGGMVTRPTLALLGESGPEAVIPLGRSRPAGNAMVQQVFNVSPGVPEAVRRELRAMMPEIRSNAVDAIMQARNRGGAVARSLGERGK